MAHDRQLEGRKIAVLVETGFNLEEIRYYSERLPQLGGKVTLLSYLWGKSNIDLVNDIDSPDRKITDVRRLTITECVTHHDPNQFDIVICAANYVAVRLREIPPKGSLASTASIGSAPAVDFFARAMANKQILKAAICHALWILTPRPDLLRGRLVTCDSVVLADIRNAGATYVAAPSHVVVDDDLVTARSLSDMDAFIEAITASSQNRPHAEPTRRQTERILRDTSADIVGALESRFAVAAQNFAGGDRPVARSAGALVAGTLDIPGEVRRFVGVDLDRTRAKVRKPILLLASKFGNWSSELAVVAGVLLAAGYKVKVATEDGLQPHLHGPNLDPSFEDGARRSSVVSVEEQALALRFLDSHRPEHALLQAGALLDLSKLPRPPQVGDYLRNRAVLGHYSERLGEIMCLAREHDAIVIAGASGAIPGFMADRAVHALILAFNRLGKPIMAECNGGLALAQTVDPTSGRSILHGKAVTTHSFPDEYQAGWGWTAPFASDTRALWEEGKFAISPYRAAEQRITPGVAGNPLIDSELLFSDAAAADGVFFSPPGTPYCVVVDENLITCRTTPDGYPGVLALMAVMDGCPPLRGRFFIDGDRRGRRRPAPSGARHERSGRSPVEAARSGDLAGISQWLAAGGDPDVSDGDGWTPLLAAAARGHSDVVDLLLGHDFPDAQRADPTVRFAGADALPIYLAGQSGDVSTVMALLRVRPEHLFDVASVNGHTVLLQTAFFGTRAHQALARYLLEHVGEILNIEPGDTRALADARRRLLTVTNVRGQSPIALANAYGISSMVEIFQEFGLPDETECADYCRRLLRQIQPLPPRNPEEAHAQALTEKLIAAIQEVLDGEHGASVAAIRDFLTDGNIEVNRLGGPLQRTPLITVCTGADRDDQTRAAREQIVDMLLQREADPLIHEVHAMGVNAVVRAAVWGHLPLLEKFAKVVSAATLADALNEKPAVNGFTALHDSVLRALTAQGPLLDRYVTQITWLISHGAHSDIEDHSGRTQLALAKEGFSDPSLRGNAVRVLDALGCEATVRA